MVRICAFNVQVLGPKKIEKPAVVRALVQIMNSYDIILIQEIRDNDDRHGIATKLLTALNALAKPDQFAFAQSMALGSYGPSRERYAYFYRVNTVKRSATFQWPINNYSVFARPPFSIKVQAPDNSFFLFIGIHVAPNSAVDEINALTGVHDTYDKQENVPIVIGGDFNAAPTYVKPEDWPRISLSKPPFRWLIHDSQAPGDTWDTTVTQQGKAYDRFVTTNVKFDQAKVDKDPLVNIAVSDHRPIACKYA